MVCVIFDGKKILLKNESILDTGPLTRLSLEIGEALKECTLGEVFEETGLR